MIAKLAYLTSPAPGVFVLNYQVEGDGIARVEISKAHLANILIDGTALALRDSSVHRVPEIAGAREG
jgi:hypothetical protein